MSLWWGERVSQEIFWEKFEVQRQDKSFWSRRPLDHEILFTALEKFRLQLLDKKGIYKELLLDLESFLDPQEALDLMAALVDFMNPLQLRTKLHRELGTDFPFELRRISTKEKHFECWFPLGTLVHVTPNNSPLLNVFAVIEGLLSGNINLLKLARKDTDFAELFFSELCQLDESLEIKNYISLSQVSSQQSDHLQKFLSVGDVISAWGHEESLEALRKIAPPQARFIDWGHKISMAYLTFPRALDEFQLQKLAEEVCLNEQQSCSSPQVVYLDTEDRQKILSWAKTFSSHLMKVSQSKKRPASSPSERAEITIQTEQVRLAEILDESRLMESPEKDWRLYIDFSSGLRASPLFRTLWVKPLPKSQILETLTPLKKYLQTVGLVCNTVEVFELVPLFFQTGVLRIKPLGDMTNSYYGEPHDGVCALQRFCKKVTLTDFHNLDGYTSIETVRKATP